MTDKDRQFILKFVEQFGDTERRCLDLQGRVKMLEDWKKDFLMNLGSMNHPPILHTEKKLEPTPPAALPPLQTNLFIDAMFLKKGIPMLQDELVSITREVGLTLEPIFRKYEVVGGKINITGFKDEPNGFDFGVKSGTL